MTQSSLVSSSNNIAAACITIESQEKEKLFDGWTIWLAIVFVVQCAMKRYGFHSFNEGTVKRDEKLIAIVRNNNSAIQAEWIKYHEACELRQQAQRKGNREISSFALNETRARAKAIEVVRHTIAELNCAGWPYAPIDTTMKCLSGNNAVAVSMEYWREIEQFLMRRIRALQIPVKKA